MTNAVLDNSEKQQKDAERASRRTVHLNLMVRFLNKHRINIRRLDKWRWLGGGYGEINGIPTMRGKAVMTNGIEVLIEMENGEVKRGHFDWFVEDDVLGFVDSNTKLGRTKQPPAWVQLLAT